jgi:outer membrane protein OmpA-like peptidoglycan-associated protein
MNNRRGNHPEIKQPIPAEKQRLATGASANHGKEIEIMLIRRLFLVLLALLLSGVAFAAGKSDLNINVAKPGATLTIERVMKDGKALVSVVDSGKSPLLGLTAADFSVTEAGRQAKITSVQPISESLDIPRHIVLVLDNSLSMDMRNAVGALLSGVGELLKTVRPIDDVQIVVFSNKKVEMAGRRLSVQTFMSNQPAELQAFVTKAYKDEMTGKTMLYDAMLAGLELVGKMPAGEPRFMVVFSDGEDTSSSVNRKVVLEAAQNLQGFNAFAIDYMPGKYIDDFLSKFVGLYNGQVWKAESEANIVSIFQSVASRMLYYYVVSYQFPPTGTLAVAPGELTIDEILTMGATTPSSRLDTSELTLRPKVDSASGIARWKVIVSNATGKVAELAGEGAPAAELKVTVPATDLQALAAGGDLTVRMELEDSIGQNLELSPPPVKVKTVQTRATLSVAPASVTIEEIKTIDASPMLGHIFFATGSSDLSPQYVRFSEPGETAGFDEQKFTTTLDKYYQDLNIVGKRLVDNTGATITLIGCNDNSGKEKGNKKLSTRRAEAVRDYLQSVWEIAPGRIAIQARNLPAKPSSIRLKEGQAENRRVEILSTDPEILAPIRSIYLATRIDTPNITLRPDVVAPYGIADWKITAVNGSGTLDEQAGKGSPTGESTIQLGSRDLKTLATGGDIKVKMELKDSKGQGMVLAPEPVKVNFIQTSQLLAEKKDQRVQEKYALILFDFDKDTIEAQNKEIVNRIVERIKKLPNATVEIIGHTDNIGKEAYNLKLSQRRALAVYKLLSAAYGESAAERIRYSGVGPNSPLFDNQSPEGRSFNRTVTITLEYLSAE